MSLPLQAILEHLPVGVVVFQLEDPDDPGSLRYRYANAAFEGVVGFDVREHIGKTIGEVSPELVNTGLAADYAQVALSGVPLDQGEIRYGSARVVRSVFNAKAFPLPDMHVGIVAENISQRKMAEEKAREQQSEAEKWSTVFQNAGVAMAIGDPEMKIEAANPAMEALFGHDRGELVGTPIEALFSDPDRESFAELAATLNNQGRIQFDTHGVQKQGGVTPMLVEVATLEGGHLGPGYTFATVHDITALTRAQEDLSRSNEGLKRSNMELERFAYVASHDLQEPLRTIASYSQLVQRRYSGQLDAQGDLWLGLVMDGADRMSSLIQDLLVYSRINSKAQPFFPVDLEVLLKEVLATLANSLEDSGTTLTFDDLPTVQGDRAQLSQLLQNLLSNAIKFRSEDTAPHIHIKANSEGGIWRFEIKDNGIGIKAEYTDRIFDIFKRLHSRRKYPGTGLGLSICRKVVERHGGQIQVASTPGEGSTFSFTLPAA